MTVVDRDSSRDADVRQHVGAFVRENFLYLRPELELRDSDDLLALGVMDSMGFVELVEEVETRYGLVIQDVEITEDNFGSVDAVVAYVASKRAP
jgi:acyl carrier protein